MDHELINQSNLIDEYLMGHLPEEESAQFEEHFVDCPECIARLQMTGSFLQDLRFALSEQERQPAPPPKKFSPRHILRSFLPASAVWTTVSLLIALAIIAAFAGIYALRSQTEAKEAKSLSEQWKQRYEDEHRSAIAAESSHREKESHQEERLRALEAKIREEETQRAKMAAELDRQTRPQGNLFTFELIAARGGNPAASEPVNRVELPRPSASIAFSISLEDEQRFESYRVKIFDDHRRLISPGIRLIPTRYDSLFIVFKPNFFRPGRYELIVEGVNKEGGREAVGNYPFLIVKAR
jgi:hypothetical protein